MNICVCCLNCKDFNLYFIISVNFNLQYFNGSSSNRSNPFFNRDPPSGLNLRWSGHYFFIHVPSISVPWYHPLLQQLRWPPRPPEVSPKCMVTIIHRIDRFSFLSYMSNFHWTKVKLVIFGQICQNYSQQLIFTSSIPSYIMRF